MEAIEERRRGAPFGRVSTVGQLGMLEEEEGPDGSATVVLPEAAQRQIRDLLEERANGIFLRDVQLGNDGAAKLAQAISGAEGLQFIDIAGGGIGNDGAKALAEVLTRAQHITSVHLPDNTIGDDGARDLAAAFWQSRRLFSVDLSGNRVITPRGAASLGAALSHTPRLRFLNLSGNKIRDGGAEQLSAALSGAANLRSVDLSDSEIGLAGAKHLSASLSRAKDLQSVRLGGNPLGDAGVAALSEALCRARDLQDVRLPSCGIGEEGALSLAHAVRGARHLQSIDLSRNALGDDGAKVIAAALRLAPHIRRVCLAGCAIKDRGLLVLSEVLHDAQELRAVDLSANPFGDEGAAALAEALQHAHCLEAVRLSRCRIGDAVLAALVEGLRHHASLSDVDLSSTPIGQLGAKALAGVLRHAREVRCLDLSRTRVRDTGVAAVARALLNAERLQLFYLDAMADAGAAALAAAFQRARRLRSLDLSFCRLGDQGAAALGELLRGAPHLQAVELSWNLISSSGAAALAKGLRDAPRIRSFHLPSNCVGNAGAEALADVLRSAERLRAVDLSGNLLNQSGAGAVARLLAEITPPALSSLEGVELSGHLDAMELPPELSGESNFRILSFLRERQRAGAVRMGIAKVIVTGPEYGGKTCLVQRLLTGAYDENTDTTDGVRVRSLVLGEGDSLELLFFDLGGHDVYRSWHQLFLRTRAVFLVAFDRSAEDGAFHEFARDVLDANPRAPVVLVSTKADAPGQRPLAPPQVEALSRQYPALRGYFHVSALRDGDPGLAALRDRGIVEVARNLRHMDREVPLTYLRLRAAIQEMRGRGVFFIEQADFYRMAGDVGLAKDSADTALFLFDAWGLVQRLPPRFGLAEADLSPPPVVLQPHRLAAVLSQVITAHSDKVRNARYGLFRHADAARVWSTYNASLHTRFITMIHKCELGFEVALEGGTGHAATLVPGMLSCPWDDRAARLLACLRARFAAFEEHAPLRLSLTSLPEKMVAELLVRLRFYLAVGGWWKTGCVLVLRTHGRVTAFARLDYDTMLRKSVSIRCFGADALRMRVLEVLAQLRDAKFPGVSFTGLALGCRRYGEGLASLADEPPAPPAHPDAPPPVLLQALCVCGRDLRTAKLHAWLTGASRGAPVRVARPALLLSVAEALAAEDGAAEPSRESGEGPRGRRRGSARRSLPRRRRSRSSSALRRSSASSAASDASRSTVPPRGRSSSLPPAEAMAAAPQTARRQRKSHVRRSAALAAPGAPDPPADPEAGVLLGVRRLVDEALAGEKGASGIEEALLSSWERLVEILCGSGHSALWLIFATRSDYEARALRPRPRDRWLLSDPVRYASALHLPPPPPPPSATNEPVTPLVRDLLAALDLEAPKGARLHGVLRDPSRSGVQAVEANFSRVESYPGVRSLFAHADDLNAFRRHALFVAREEDSAELERQVAAEDDCATGGSAGAGAARGAVRALRGLLGGADLPPRLLWVRPAAQMPVERLFRPRCWLHGPLRVSFVCPETFAHAGPGAEASPSREQLREAAPHLVLGLEVLRQACAAGRALGLPVPGGEPLPPEKEALLVGRLQGELVALLRDADVARNIHRARQIVAGRLVEPEDREEALELRRSIRRDLRRGADGVRRLLEAMPGCVEASGLRLVEGGGGARDWALAGAGDGAGGP